ncbi:3' terminal RNA ribose 2'-O-methyltransferase Hen1 [Murinocardiopsis flavida]|uniref:Small RNA 2'-O-methyltransferase n=1 Tax=Murinocardiopsis flavida TaxID=645275 RepID=A0A2P8D6U9_9ACTN|nr:3' terminal RNA ribose 2'-O-methyltransferase Hen1 [Murinocardiopsis flavida]PSK92950.1 3' terminal RNA ribose 2'-O-methyltransferase Hen1 [Murinocardiopsis flavida]
MLLTISTTHQPATDLGYLLHKHPDRVQEFTQSHGTAHVFYPESHEHRCTAALLLEIDPQSLLRTRKSVSSPDFALAQYVNDRPFAASSLFAVALGDVFRTALKGRCTARPELPDRRLPLTLSLPAVPCRGGPEYARRLFEPLGWQVRTEPVPLDPGLPDWGDSRYVGLTLTGEHRLADALSHLYVLLPVLDGAKHYWVDDDEIEKLLRAGEGWLAGHPERAGITRRYLSRRNRLFRVAIARLAEVDDLDPGADDGGETPAITEEAPDKPPALAEQRAGAVLAALKAANARSVLDLGCGPGKLVGRLLDDPQFTQVTGVDVSQAAIQFAHDRLRVETMPAAQRSRLTLLTGSVVYRDDRFAGHDAAVLMEVIEHIDPSRLPAMEQVVFGRAAPRAVVVTTPNAEYNALYEGLDHDAMRHTDHRFEWDRARFESWAREVAATYGYQVRFLPVGHEDPQHGASTQMGVFHR